MGQPLKSKRLLRVATTHAGLGDDRTVRTIGRSVITEMAQVLGATHPCTLMARSKLAVFELKLGQASHSKPELSQVLDSLRTMLREDHRSPCCSR